MTQFAAQGFVFFQFIAVLGDFLFKPLAHAPSGLHFLERAAQQAAAQRAPRNQPQAVLAAGRNHFQFNHAIVEMIN